MTDDQVRSVIATLKSSQRNAADKGVRRLCSRCKSRLTPLGGKICETCSTISATEEKRPPTLSEIFPPTDPLYESKNRIAKLEAQVLKLEQLFSKTTAALVLQNERREEMDIRITALAQALAEHEADKSNHGGGMRLLTAAEICPQPTPENDPDLLKSFAGFERVCRGMRAKCPHLFAATVRRAAAQ